MSARCTGIKPAGALFSPEPCLVISGLDGGLADVDCLARDASPTTDGHHQPRTWAC